MEKAMIAFLALMGLSFIGMAVAVFFDKSRLIDFFYLACMVLGGVTLVLSLINLLLI